MRKDKTVCAQRLYMACVGFFPSPESVSSYLSICILDGRPLAPFADCHTRGPAAEAQSPQPCALIDSTYVICHMRLLGKLHTRKEFHLSASL